MNGMQTVRAVVAGALLSLFCGNALAAEIFIKGFPEASWRELDALSRIRLLSLESAAVYVGGPIAQGDAEELRAIHALLPVHTLHISSPGGSVAEAVKISQFVEEFSIAVRTEHSFQCDAGSMRSSLPDDKQCGCASACAFIWLAAPVRYGSEVKIHRPYFARSDFGDLPDEQALAAYNAASQQVRSMLDKRGYSSEFVGRLFNTPRENYQRLKKAEIDGLPVDTSLDELVSARCYGDSAQALSQYYEYQHQVAELARTVRGLSASLPGDVILGELAKDSYYGPILRDRDEAERKMELLKKTMAELEPLKRKFESCKQAERQKISLRKAGPRLTAEVRAKLHRFGELVSLNANLAVLVPNDPDTNKPMAMDEEEMTALRSQLQAELPATYWDYMRSAH